MCSLDWKLPAKNRTPGKWASVTLCYEEGWEGGSEREADPRDPLPSSALCCTDVIPQ
jgi:hypothetical protein